MTTILRARDRWIKVIPVRIMLFDQPNFPCPIPLLQPFLTLDRILGIIELLEVDEFHNVIPLGEALDDLRFVLEDVSDDVIRHANVERATNVAGQDVQDVDVVMACSQLPPLGYWIAWS